MVHLEHLKKKVAEEGVVDRMPSQLFTGVRDCPVRKKKTSVHDHESIAVRRYLENNTKCRRRMLLKYFVDAPLSTSKQKDNCCDVCTSSQ